MPSEQEPPSLKKTIILTVISYCYTCLSVLCLYHEASVFRTTYTNLGDLINQMTPILTWVGLIIATLGIACFFLAPLIGINKIESKRQLITIILILTGLLITNSLAGKLAFIPAIKHAITLDPIHTIILNIGIGLTSLAFGIPLLYTLVILIKNHPCNHQPLAINAENAPNSIKNAEKLGSTTNTAQNTPPQKITSTPSPQKNSQ